MCDMHFIRLKLITELSMLKKYILFVILLLNLTGKAYSQRVEGVAAMVGAAAVIGAAVVQREQLEEKIELLGTNYVLENFKTKAFELSLNGLKDQSKAFDPSTISIYAFNYSELDPVNRAPIIGGRKVILMVLDNGWINEYGLDITKIKFYPINQQNWNVLYFKYLSLASGIDILNSKIPHYTESKPKTDQSFILRNNKRIYKSDETTEISFTTLTNRGLVENKTGDLILPFTTINSDSYVVDDSLEDYKVVYNERSLGLFINSLSRLVQIRTSIVSDITFYLNSF